MFVACYRFPSEILHGWNNEARQDEKDGKDGECGHGLLHGGGKKHMKVGIYIRGRSVVSSFFAFNFFVSYHWDYSPFIYNYPRFGF